MNLLYSNLIVYVISILVFLAQTSRKLQFPTRTRVFLNEQAGEHDVDPPMFQFPEGN